MATSNTVSTGSKVSNARCTGIIQAGTAFCPIFICSLACFNNLGARFPVRLPARLISDA